LKGVQIDLTLLVLQDLKNQLELRGSKTIRSLGRVFRSFDSFDRNNQIDADEFYSGLIEQQCKVTREDASTLLKFLDRDNSGTIDMKEFLVGIRVSLSISASYPDKGQPNQRRQMIINKAFIKFDKDLSGFIEPNDLEGVYDTSHHPKVRSGEMTERQVFCDFLESFGDVNGDFKISKDEWDDYYAAVSSNIDNDDHFIMLMQNAWKLDR